LLEDRAFFGPQFGEARRVTDAGQFGVLLRLVQRPLCCGAVGGLFTLQLLAAQGQVGA
jgi:hypothetical protein